MSIQILSPNVVSRIIGINYTLILWIVKIIFYKNMVKNCIKISRSKIKLFDQKLALLVKKNSKNVKKKTWNV